LLIFVPELVNVILLPAQKVPPPPAVIEGGVTTEARIGVLGDDVQPFKLAST
jgi:hypothetical protein